MKSRADIIRAIREAKVSIKVVAHWQPQLVGTIRTPKVIRNNGKRGIQTNGYWFDGVSHSGKATEMWAELPPAAYLRFNEDGTVTFHPDQPTNWTLQFEKSA